MEIVRTKDKHRLCKNHYTASIKTKTSSTWLLIQGMERLNGHAYPESHWLRHMLSSLRTRKIKTGVGRLLLFP